MEPKNLNLTSDFPIIIRITGYISWGFFFLGFIIPYIAKIELNASGIQIGLMTSVQVFGYTMSSLFVGMITDRLPKKILIAIGAFGRAFAYIVLYLAVIMRSLIFMTIGTFSIGFLVGFFWIPLDTMISEKSAKANRSYAFGLRTRAMGIGSLIGGIIGMGSFLLFSKVTPNQPSIIYFSFLIYMFGNVYAGLLFLVKIDEKLVIPESVETPISVSVKTKPNEQNPRIPRSYIFAVGLLMITVLIAGMNGEIARPFIQVYVLTNLTQDPLIAALVYTPAGILGMIIAPRIGDIVDRKNLYASIIVTSAFGAIITWILINVNNLWIFAIILTLDSIIATISQLIGQNIFSRISKRHRGKILGLQSLASNSGGAVGPIIGGWAWDQFGTKSPFITSIFIELSLIPIFIGAVKALKPHMSEKLEDKNTKNEV
jgi:MFS family permease